MKKTLQNTDAGKVFQYLGPVYIMEEEQNYDGVQGDI